MVWVERYLIYIYDKVPLLGAIALFIPLCGDVDHISDAMRCGPFVSSVRSSNSHTDLLLTQQHHHPTFSDHTGPQHWTSTAI